MMGNSSEFHFNVVKYDEHGNETEKTTVLFDEVTNSMTEVSEVGCKYY